MAITFHPRPGAILVCDFRGFVPPEMIKLRPVIIISPHYIKRHGLYTVVPLSQTEPDTLQPFHVHFPHTPVPGERGPCWAKCDMVVSVSVDRLDRKKVGRGDFRVVNIKEAELDAILSGVKYALGIK